MTEILNNMPIERCEDRSVLDFLKSKLPAFVNIVDGFPEEILIAPTVSIEWENIRGFDFQLGSRNYKKERVWYIDVFALNKSQRDDFAVSIFNWFQSPIPVYDYNLDAKPKINALTPIMLEIRNLYKFQEEGKEEFYYRAVVIYTATLALGDEN